jgi:hypothetical protein
VCYTPLSEPFRTKLSRVQKMWEPFGNLNQNLHEDIEEFKEILHLSVSEYVFYSNTVDEIKLFFKWPLC